MSVSLSSNPAAGIVEVKSEPSWVAFFFERAWISVWMQMSEELNKCSGCIKQGWTNTMQSCLRKDGCWNTFVRNIGQFRRNGVEQSRQFGDLSSDTLSTCRLLNFLFAGGMVPASGVGTWLGSFWLARVAKD